MKPTKSQMEEGTPVLTALVKRLREYTSHPKYKELQSDLTLAAGIIDDFIKNTDDYK